MICPSCFKTITSVGHSACSPIRPPFRHYVGADATTTDTSTAATTSTTDYQSTSVDAYKAAEWKDLELLYPVLWPDWIARKILDSAFDPSQTSDPQEKRRMLAAVAKQLNTVIETCSSVPQADRTGWVQFTQAFIPWFNKGPDDSLFGGNKADNEQADSYQDQLRAWEEEISKYCNIGMPLLPKSAPTLSQLGHETLETAGKYFDTVKTVMFVGLAGVVIFIFVLGKSGAQRVLLKAIPK